MPGFLEGYGAADARRERIARWLAWAAVVLLVLGIAGYFTFRGWREKRQADRFVQLLIEKNFADAYRLWGCDPQKPCRDYPFERFLEDWGQVNPAQARITDKNCASGIIRSFEFSAENRSHIWIDKGDRSLSFAPYDDSCFQPRIQRR